MKAQDPQIVPSDLIGVMDAGENLPDYIFSKKFENHLFFDADITTCDQLICGIKEVVLRGVGPLLSVAVFSSTTRETLGVVAPDEDWTKIVMGITESMHKRGDYCGYIIV